MDEFNKLLENELLSEDTKTALSEAVEQFQATAITEAKKELEVEYAQKLVTEKTTLAKDLHQMVNEAVDVEIEELKTDLAHYKNLEVDYAKRLDTFKEEYSTKLSADIEALIETQIVSEFEEVKTDLLEAKNNMFGMELFESFKSVFERLGVSADMKELQAKFTQLESVVSEKNTLIEGFERTDTLNGLLENLSGSNKEVMASILESVATDKLETRYNESIASVLKTDDNVDDDDETTKTLTETVNVDEDSNSNADLERYRTLIS